MGAFMSKNAKNTNSIVLQFILSLYKMENRNLYSLAEKVGIVESICTQLRLLPYNLKEGWCSLPESLLKEYGTSAEELLRGEASLDQITPVISLLLEAAQNHWVEAKNLKKTIKGENLSPLRMASLLPAQLKQLKESGADILHSPIELSPFMTPVRLWRGKW